MNNKDIQSDHAHPIVQPKDDVRVIRRVHEVQRFSCFSLCVHDHSCALWFAEISFSSSSAAGQAVRCCLLVKKDEKGQQAETKVSRFVG